MATTCPYQPKVFPDFTEGSFAVSHLCSGLDQGKQEQYTKLNNHLEWFGYKYFSNLMRLASGNKKIT